MGNSLLPPNASQLERDLETTLASNYDLSMPVGDTWNPDTCPEHLLPWLAWALSVDTWDGNWPEAVKRERLKQTIKIQQAKGTVKSVRDVVASFGGDLALKEWHQQSPYGTPYTFNIVLEAGSATELTEEMQQDIIKEVNRTKPVRATYALSLAIQATGNLGTVAAPRLYNYRRLQMVES